jgi:hypothetical protein
MRRSNVLACVVAVVASIAILIEGRASAGEAWATVYGGVRPQSTNDQGAPSFSRSIFGVGVDVMHEPRTNEGFVARAGAAVEWQGFCTPGTCPWPPNDGRNGDVARHGEVGLHGRIGWEWRHVGLEGGALMRTDSFTHPDHTVLVAPDFLVRFGTLHDVWFGIGGGAYNAPTIFSPGLYGLLHIGLGPRAFLEFAGGVHEWGPWGDRPLWRVDGCGAGRIGRRWFIGGGGAIMQALHNDSAMHGELRFFAGLEF